MRGALVVAADTAWVALPLESVVETLRPLPVEAVAGVPEYIRGVSLIRGAPVVVVDLARLLGRANAPPARRLVVLRTEAQPVALLVQDVVGVRELEAFQALDPLLAESEAVETVGGMEQRLVVVLRCGRIVPPEVWAALSRQDSR